MTDLEESTDDAWFDESELRWDATTRVVRIVVAFMVLATVAGTWLIASRLVLDDVCQSTRANVERVVLDACQSRTSWSDGPLKNTAQPLPAAMIALAASGLALTVASLTLALGNIRRFSAWSNRFDAPAAWAMWGLVAIVVLAALWATIGSVAAILSTMDLVQAI